MDIDLDDNKKSRDAEEILSEFQKTQEPEPEHSEPESEQAAEQQPQTAEPEQYEPQQQEPQTEEHESYESQQDTQTAEPEPYESQQQDAPTEQYSETPEQSHGDRTGESSDDDSNASHVIFVGTKPLMMYVKATLMQFEHQPTVTIKARGKRITQAVDVSQIIIKRANSAGYFVSGVRIAADSLTSQDGKNRNVSTIEIDVTKN